jgi:ABC-2 type transport system ATP-binding protein
MIEARALTKRYGATVAVDALTFDIRPGVVTGFLGPNGAGKSTTMRMILGLDHPTAGNVSVGGRRYRDLAAPMREVGALLDAGAVHGKRTARRHLRWLAGAGGPPRRRLLARDVAAARHRRGAARRPADAAVRRADERARPRGHPLDPHAVAAFAAEGRTVVVSSHLMHEMEETADHVLVIGRGRLIADASMAEFTRRAGGRHVHVASPDAAALAAVLERAGGVVTGGGGTRSVAGLGAARIGDLAAEHGLRVHELTPRRASLEAAFMELTEASVEYRPEVMA